MAYKFEIIENSLVITNDVNNEVVLDSPKRDVYYDNEALKKDFATIYDTSSLNKLNSKVFNCAFGQVKDGNGIAFTKTTFVSFCRENLGFNTGGAESGSGAYVPVYEVASYDSYAGINSTTEIEVKGSFLDYINEAKITASIDNNEVSVSIKSKSFNSLILEVTANNVVQTYDVLLCSGSNQTKILQLKTETIKVPTTSDWQNISSGLSVFDGGVQTNSTATGWNKQANFGSIPANSDGELTFVFDGSGVNGSSTSIGMIGFCVDPTANASYNTIDHAIYVNGTTKYIYENGASRGNFGQVGVGDIFKIVRQFNQITYYHNGEVFYASTILSTGELFFDCSLYRNIKISNIKLIS